MKILNLQQNPTLKTRLTEVIVEFPETGKFVVQPLKIENTQMSHCIDQWEQFTSWCTIHILNIWLQN